MGRRSSMIIVMVLLLAASACARGEDSAAAPVDPPSETATPAPELELPSAPATSAVPTRRSTASAVPSGFSEMTATSCNGQPTVQQVGALVKNILKNVTPSASKGPLCSGTWQFTVLTVPDAEPLQVVTRGQPTSLVLVTAGTNVCTPAVRGAAPPGILTATGC
ncbi:hypothetical protein Val02_83540 [Virgisporangium aliadipatigenens]|uniref:Lipoprotein n=1 Tax=Virgisporangium aliadipatigenens TaxID=741659 RepID=A0A8J3YVU2_9ACTN|nr:hypothetical protein [Virgisporangium aliadipatigenens]GIJ51468.1 hypothetical protein Val02_83540 [Virgisporangium aliadipatigenens]